MTNMPMSKLDLNALSLDELWTLHERLSNILTQRMVVEKRELEQRLVQLDRGRNTTTWPREGDRQRQKYLGVAPKYQNPSSPTETWSGRGKQPRWLISAIAAGGRVEDFKIPNSRIDE
jgi:DNA-binding protein H-NS